MAAWPLPGPGSPLGGLILFFDEEQTFPVGQRQLLEAAARRAAEALLRIWLVGGRDDDRAPFADTTEDGTGERARELLDGTPLAPGSARRFLRLRLAE